MNPQPRSRVRAIFLNLLLLLVGVVGALVMLEILLRLYNPFQSRIKGNRIVLITNKQYHIRNNIIPSLEPVVTVTRNSLGFRGPNPPPDLANDLSIVTIGGSTTQCFFLSDDKTWTARLSDLLQPSVAKLWVNNAGLDGHSTFGHLVLLEDHVKNIHPKVAIFLVGANDVARDPDVDFDAENVKSSISFRSPTAFVKSLSPYSEVAALIANLYRSLNAYREGLMHQKVDLKEQGYFDASPEVQQKYIAATAADHYLRGYESRLRQLVAVSKANGIEPVLVTQPLLAGGGIDDVTGVDLSRVRANPIANGKMWWDSLEVYNDVTRRVGRENGLLVIDLARELPKSSRMFYDFVHFSAEGAQQVANIIYKHLCPVLATQYPGFFSSPACPAIAAHAP
jgi:lysophospholipase L1-like esterase